MRSLMSVNNGMWMLRLCSVFVLLALPGCSVLIGKTAGLLFKKQLAKNQRVGEAKVVGVVEMVNPEQGYVLINCEQRLNLPAGTEVIALKTDGTQVKLKITPEHKGNYITADIKNGEPEVRDLVLYQVKPGPLQAPTAPQAMVAGSSTEPSPPTAGPAVPLTPVMQADYIPPLDTPFQPMQKVKPAQAPAFAPQAPPPVVAPAPKSEPAAAPEAEPDPSALQPVIR